MTKQILIITMGICSIILTSCNGGSDETIYQSSPNDKNHSFVIVVESKRPNAGYFLHTGITAYMQAYVCDEFSGKYSVYPTSLKWSSSDPSKVAVNGGTLTTLESSFGPVTITVSNSPYDLPSPASMTVEVDNKYIDNLYDLDTFNIMDDCRH